MLRPVLLALAILAPVTADAAVSRDSYRIRGLSAWGDHYAGSADGCSWESAYAQGFEDRIHDAGQGRPVTSSGGYVYAEFVDECTGEAYYASSFDNGALAATFEGTIDAATLTVPVAVYRCVLEDTWTCTYAGEGTASVAWTGRGDLSRQHSRWHSHSTGEWGMMSFMFRYSGTEQRAEASLDLALPWGETTTVDLEYASIGIYNRGELYISRE